MSTEEEEFLTTWKSEGPQTLPLTDEERVAVEQVAIRLAVAEAEKKKGLARYNELYWRSVEDVRYFPQLSADEFFEFIVEAGKRRSVERNWSQEFQIDNDNRVIVKALARYFTDTPSFVKMSEGFSLNKGILLIGDTGCGKTQLMELCTRNQKAPYTRHNCQQIAREYAGSGQKGGETVIVEYSGNERSVNGVLSMGYEFFGRFFDDLGAESTNVKHFGNESNVMAEIISKRYDAYQHHMTHFTSNLTLEELKTVYGKRVYDRLREMCNIIEFSASAKSRRK